MSSQEAVNSSPSLLWVIVPSVLLISGYYVRKWYLARRLRIHGIGRGAPGFQTSVKKLRVTPEIAARIRRGEKVSPEEIDAAARKANIKSDGAQELSQSGGGGLPGMRVVEERDDRHLINVEDREEEVMNEWLPDSVTKPNKRKKGRKY